MSPTSRQHAGGLGALLIDPYRGALARLARLETGPLAATLERLRSTPDHRGIPRDFARQHAIHEEWAPYMITSSVADHPDLQPIRDHVALLLNGA